ncbi:MAG: hypothetical protein K0Q51_590 [Rickettsiaceae bacterium]|jgi:LPS export ABC transporter protein LptC|nr:hypothetical protein [Rickettsiaceae bacterium]
MTYTEKHFKNLFMLKLACLTIAGIVVLVVFSFSLYNFIETKRGEIRNLKDLSFSNISILEDTSVNIKDLNLSGKTTDDSDYNLTASEANKNTKGIIQMKDIQFSFSQKDQGNLIVTSDSGSMLETEKLIKINNSATIKFRDYTVKTNQLDIDLKNYAAKSNDSIIMTKGDSYLQADSFSTTNNSEIINLNGNVKASIDLSDTKSQ